MRRVVSLFLPAWSTDRLRRILGDAAPLAEAPLVLTACESIVAEDRGRPSINSGWNARSRKRSRETRRAPYVSCAPRTVRVAIRRYWAGAINDDAQMTRALKEAGYEVYSPRPNYHDLPPARKAEEEKSNLDEELGPTQA
jgi:hypothetical protein